MSERIAFATHGFSVVVCKHPETGKFLAVNECKGRGWWLPAGHVDRGQTFVEAALKETVEEAGLDVQLKGVLAVEHTLQDSSNARMRVIFYAEPVSLTVPPKSVPDEESEGAAWMTLAELEQKRSMPPPEGLRGDELLRWGRYVQSGGLIAPLTVSANGKYDGFFRLETAGPNFDCSLAHPAMREGEGLLAALPAPTGSTVPGLPAPSAAAASVTSPPDVPVTGDRLRRLLLEGSISDINRGLDVKHWTLLHRAVALGEETSVRMLLLGGANPNVVTHKGRTPLHMAVSRGDLGMVMLLLMAGADASIRDCDGATATMFLPAAKTCNSSVIEKIGVLLGHYSNI